MPGWTFHITTFGCKVNQYESQAIREAWLDLGGEESASPEEAHVALVNSCAVTAHGERDARHALYRLHREAPAARRILTGCSACLVGRTLAGNPCLDVLVPPRAKALLLRGPWALLSGEKSLPEDAVAPPFGAEGFRIARFRRARPVVKVQDGCSHRCTYCIVPLVRGSAVSRAADEVLAEVSGLLEAGYGEIMLSGINLHQYGRGLPPEAREKDFWDLLRRLDAALAPRWAGRARLRLSSLEPTQLNTRGLETLGQCRMLCPHAHLSLQHGSPDILRRMGRGHCRPEKLLDAVRQLRQIWPRMGLGADLLMGFPGENDGHVQDTLQMVAALGLTYAHVFPYSCRPGTPAATFPQQTPHAEKLARAARVRQAVETQKQAFLESLLPLPRIAIVADSPANATPGTSPSESRRGVSEHYAPCRLIAAEAPDTAGGASPAAIPSVAAIPSLEGLIPARPLRVEQGVLVATPLSGAPLPA